MHSTAQARGNASASSPPQAAAAARHKAGLMCVAAGKQRVAHRTVDAGGFLTAAAVSAPIEAPD